MDQNKNNLINNFLEDGYVALKNCISHDLINLCKLQINDSLIRKLKEKNKTFSKNYNENFYECIKLFNQHEIQKYLAKELINNNIVKNILLENYLNSFIKSIIGLDIEYHTSFELAINVKDEKDEYLVKKFHQEFWSGVGINSVLLWIPLSLENGMGTIDIVRGSHKWGHIPHRNREPVSLPEDAEIQEVNDINEKDVLIFTSLTLHRTAINKHEFPRFAMPVVVRNFYYPKTNNEDLMNFEILNLSPISKFRKLLGNSQFSPFRTIGSKREII